MARVRDLMPQTGTRTQELLVRALHCRLASTSKPKFEVFFVDGPGMKDVVLAEAWGPEASAIMQKFKNGCVHIISGYSVSHKGSSYSMGNRDAKLQLSMKTIVKSAPEDAKSQAIPSSLPLTKIADITLLRNPTLVCLTGIIKESQGLTERQTKLGPGKVCNFAIMEGEVDIRGGFWGSAGEDMASKELGSSARLDLVLVSIGSDGKSVELKALDSTRISAVSEEMHKQLQEGLATGTTKSLTKVAWSGQGRNALDAKAIVTNINVLGELVQCTASAMEDSFIMDPVFEVPSCHVLDIRGPQPTHPERLAYQACAGPSCKNAKIGSSGSCIKCGSSVNVADRILLTMTIADPMGTKEVTVYHETASQILGTWPANTTQELRAALGGRLVTVRCDLRKRLAYRPTDASHGAASQASQGASQITQSAGQEQNQEKYIVLAALAEQVTAEGALQIFRADQVILTRIRGGIPTVEAAKVIMDSLEQTTYGGAVFDLLHLVVKVSGPSQRNRDGSKEVRGLCVLSGHDVILYCGPDSDAYATITSTSLNNIMSVVASYDSTSENAKLFSLRALQIMGEDVKDMFVRICKYQAAAFLAVAAGKGMENESTTSPIDLKRKCFERAQVETPEWTAKNRRLAPRNSDEIQQLVASQPVSTSSSQAAGSECPQQ